MLDRQITRRHFLELLGIGIAATAILPGCAPFASNSILANNAQDFSNEVRDLASGAFTLLWTSDTHYNQSDKRLARVPEYFETVYQVADKLQPAALVVNGDIVDGKDTLSVHKTAVQTVRDKLSKCPVPLIVVRGNHDGNNYYTENVTHDYSLSEIVDTAWLSQNLIQPVVDAGCVFDSDNPESCYYYRDFPEAKIRMVVLDDIDIPYMTLDDGTLKYHALVDFGFGARQVAWIANKALRFSEAGWAVIVAVHVNFNDDRIYGLRAWGSVQSAHNDRQVQTLLQAFTTNESGRVVNTDSDFQTDVRYDFSDNPSNEFICCLNGHTHRDQAVFTGGILNLTLRAFAASDHGCFDAVVVDRSNGIVHTRAFDAVSGVSPNWDIDYRSGAGIPEAFNYYYGNRVINDASELSS